MARLTKAQRALGWLRLYRDGTMNNRPYHNNSMWTRTEGRGNRDLQAAKALGYVTSRPDATIRARGWRHDITPEGRAALKTEGA